MRVRLDSKKPYSEMYGEPGVKFLQNGLFYDSNGFFVRDSGIVPPAPPIKLSKKAAADIDRMTVHAEAIARAASVLGPFTKKESTDKIMEEADRENRRALAAEERNS